MAELKGKHTIAMSGRESIAITGVLDVISFDEIEVITETELGALILKGINLHVNKLNLESGELSIDGQIYSVTYEDQNNYGKNKPSILSKIFK